MIKQDQQIFEWNCQQLKKHLQKVHSEKYKILGDPRDSVTYSTKQQPKAEQSDE